MQASSFGLMMQHPGVRASCHHTLQFASLFLGLLAQMVHEALPDTWSSLFQATVSTPGLWCRRGGWGRRAVPAPGPVPILKASSLLIWYLWCLISKLNFSWGWAPLLAFLFFSSHVYNTSMKEKKREMRHPFWFSAFLARNTRVRVLNVSTWKWKLHPPLTQDTWAHLGVLKCRQYAYVPNTEKQKSIL